MNRLYKLQQTNDNFHHGSEENYIRTWVEIAEVWKREFLHTITKKLISYKRAKNKEKKNILKINNSKQAPWNNFDLKILY